MFENLDVYRRAVDLADRIITHTKDAPRGFGFLTDQLNRAALSISTLLGGVDRECRIAFDLEAAPDAPVAVGVRAGDVIPLSDRILVPAGTRAPFAAVSSAAKRSAPESSTRRFRARSIANSRSCDAASAERKFVE